MARQRPVSYIPLNKKITHPWQINQIQFLAERWKLSVQEVCYRLIHDGLHNELKKREYIESLNSKK